MTLTDEITLLMDRYGFSRQEAIDFIKFSGMACEFPATEENANDVRN